MKAIESTYLTIPLGKNEDEQISLEKQDYSITKKFIDYFILLTILSMALLPSLYNNADAGELMCDKKNPLLVTTKKYHNFPGEMVEIMGCVSDSAPSNDLFLEIFGNSKQQVFERIDVKEDGTFYYEFQTDDEVPTSPVFWMKVTYGKLEATNYFIVSENAKRCSKEVSSENPIQIETNKQNFEKGDTLQVFACLAGEAATKGVNISVFDHDGNIVMYDVTVPNADRTIEVEFVIGDEFKEVGTYTVEVDAAGLYAANKTIVVPEFGTLIMAVLVVGLSSIVVLGVCSKKILKI